MKVDTSTRKDLFCRITFDRIDLSRHALRALELVHLGARSPDSKVSYTTRANYNNNDNGNLRSRDVFIDCRGVSRARVPVLRPQTKIAIRYATRNFIRFHFTSSLVEFRSWIQNPSGYQHWNYHASQNDWLYNFIFKFLLRVTFFSYHDVMTFATITSETI